MAEIEHPPRLVPAAGADGDLSCLAGLTKDKPVTATDQGTDRLLQICSGLAKRKRVAALAIHFKVSERLIWSSLELQRSGREDLIRAVERGQMTVHQALKQARSPRNARPSKPALPALRSAWGRASEAERAAFLQEVAP
ncbi:hypothetical protein [Dongia sp.]|uniref:hypothetical protein n=1 Tax=Dongia sp. TaxID=1977262 RepID=UPI00375020DC